MTLPSTPRSTRRPLALKRTLLSLLGAAAMLSAGLAHAALQDRDLDGNGVTDAFYDTDLNITWLRDANVNGSMNWATTVTWADTFSFGGYADWRLPSTSDKSCTFYNCTSSEMGHLWYVELGNVGNLPMANTGDFQQLGSAYYWSDEYAEFSAVVFATSNGLQGLSNKLNQGVAMAVRDGDVPATVPSIPEPETYALMLVGLAGVALATKRRARRLS